MAQQCGGSSDMGDARLGFGTVDLGTVQPGMRREEGRSRRGGSGSSQGRRPG